MRLRTFALAAIFLASSLPLRAAPQPLEARARKAVTEALQGATEGQLLRGVTLDEVRVDGNVVEVRLTLSHAAFAAIHDVRAAEGELVIEDAHRAIASALEGVEGLRVFHVLGRPPAKDPYLPLDRFLAPRAPLQRKSTGATGAKDGPPGLGQTQPTGSLSGKTVFLSQGHGWEWTTCCGWTTQRGVTNGIVEDFINAEAVNQYLIQYLHNAGAQVLTARERDMLTTTTIVDNDGNNGTSDYTENGAWATSTATGFANGFAPYGTTTNPFALGSTRVLAVSPAETGRVTFTPDVPKTGAYWVYASWGASSNRAPDAHFIIHHAGGTTHLHFDQRRDGYTWIPLGQYVFDAGKDPAKGSIVLANDSAAAGTFVSADAVRLGGGMGDIVDGGTVSGKPRWEEAAFYYTQYLGFDSWNYNDVTTRPNWAEWECEPGEDCLFFSWHTNAPNPGTGTSSYIYDGGATPGSQQLQDAIQAEVVKDIRSGWDPNWTDRGKLQANFGELRPLTSMPGVLLELAFHDTPSDATQLKQPKFRQLSARAIYQGMVRYYSATATLLPEPPVEFTAKNLGGGTVRLDWLPAPPDGLDLGGDPATGYRVYVGTDGKSWQDAIPTTSPTYTYTGTPGQMVYFKVSATNAGGESFPTETLAARVSSGQAPVLLVSGFDRIDGSALLPSNDTIGLDYRMQLWRMNSYDYTIAHAEALAAANVDFDSAVNEAVISGRVSLPSYAAVDWILGEESAGDATFDAAEQSLVAGYLTGGGDLFVSGAEIGWDLVAQGNGQAFFETSLRGSYDGDDAYAGAASPQNEATGVAGSIFAGLTNIVFDGANPTIYDVDYPDLVGPKNGSTAALTYVNGTQATSGAAVQYAGSYKLVHMGFPFETILDASKRNQMMARIMAFFGLPASTPDWDVLAGAGLGDVNPNTVKVYTPTGAGNPVTFDAYSAGKWGVNVASANLTSDSRDEILTGAGPGTVFGPHTRGFDRGGLPLAGLSFFAYSTLKYGVNVEASLLDGGVYARILTGAGPGAVFGPHVRAFRYTGTAVQALSKVSFLAYGTLKYGVNVGGADVDQDGYGEILTGPGPSAAFGATVRAFNYDAQTLTAIQKINFAAWSGGGYGVNVAGGDVDADARDEMLVANGPGPGLGPNVRGFRFAGAVAMLGMDFSAYASGQFGARVGSGDVAGDARAEILTGPGRDVAASSSVHAYAYDPASNTTAKLATPDFVAFGTLTYGVNVTGADLRY